VSLSMAMARTEALFVGLLLATGPAHALRSPPAAPPGRLACPGPRHHFAALCDEPGYAVAVAPFVSDASITTSAGGEAWRKAMIPFVPCLIRALDTWQPCDRQVAAYLLGAIGDRRAVPPLLKLLQEPRAHPDLRFSVRQVLAEHLKAQEVVPYLLESLRTSDRERRLGDIFLARDGPRDVRLLEVLMRLFEEEQRENRGKRSPPRTVFPSDRYFLLEAMAAQSEGHEEDPRLRDIMWGTLDDPVLMPSGPMLGRKIARSEDFQRFAEFFLRNAGADSGGRMSQYLGLLKMIGGEAFPPFLRRALSGPMAPYWRKTCADALVEWYFPADGRDGLVLTDPLALLDREAREALPYASAQKLQELLWRTPEASSFVGASRQAAFWERAATIIRSRDDLLFSVNYRLSLAYGPEGTGELDKAVEALRTARQLDPATFGKSGYELQLSDLERRLARQRKRSVLSIAGLIPLDKSNLFTAWQGTILGLNDNKDLSGQVPVCFLDYFDSDGLEFTLACEWRRPPPSLLGTGDLAFVVTPEARAEKLHGITGVRLRVLFVPGSEDQFSGAVSSEVVSFRDGGSR